MSEEKIKTYHIYSDESRHRAERFLLLGGIWVEELLVAECLAGVDKLRDEHGFINDRGDKVKFIGELKWTKVSRKYLQVYKDVVDLFFDWIKAGTIRSCIMLVDVKDEKVRAHNNLGEDGFFKLLYQLYFHNSKIPGLYKIFPDRITNPTLKANLPILQRSLHASFVKKFSSKMRPAQLSKVKNFVKSISPCNSKEYDLIQVLDVVMGAVGYFQNRLFEKEGCSQAKVDLMKHVMDRLIYSGVIKVEGKQYMIAKSTRFNIWQFRPK